MPVLDFAAAWAEVTGDPLVVVVDAIDLPRGRLRRVWRWLRRRPTVGERFTLPPSMPAGLRLHLWNARQAGADRDLTYGELEAASRFLFGDKAHNRLIRARITEEQLTDVVMTVLAVYATAAAAHTEPDQAGPSPGGSEAPTTSSATSGSSKPTSTGSTGSSSPEPSDRVA